ncbi:uncharacterized protein LOC129585377 [Paramacrobiotus metropolitanus]|uniref:uncharacterized protein LOC129585377 n=1 Tax=Paramacrobiotus metropolitanus TaxID=2943436 RepID=UPI002445CD7A|nr:uncharacterized protein LOC129585377 [Paramacrobiotus metropolitanus]
MYCYNQSGGNFIRYWDPHTVTVGNASTNFQTRQKRAEASEADLISALLSISSQSKMIGAPQCDDCICGLRGYSVLLKGRVPSEQLQNVSTEMGNVWKSVYDETLQNQTGDIIQWEAHPVDDTPDISLIDPLYGNLTHLTYAVIVNGVSPEEFGLPEITENDLKRYGTSLTYPPCFRCRPFFNDWMFVSGLGNSTSDTAAVNLKRALDNSFNEWNKKIARRGPLSIEPEYLTTRNFSTGNISLHMVFYVMRVPSGVSWNMLQDLDTPSKEVLERHFRAEVGPNITVYPSMQDVAQFLSESFAVSLPQLAAIVQDDRDQ